MSMETAIRLFAESLLHNLWQGALIGGLLYVLLRIVPARYAELRYWAGMAGFFFLVFSVPVTFGILSATGEDAAAPQTQAVHAPGVEDSKFSNLSIRGGEAGDSELSRDSMIASEEEPPSVLWQKWFLLAWIIGAVIGMVRVFRAAAGIRRLRIDSKPLTGLDFGDLVRRCGLPRPIPIRESARVASACVCGFFRPVILLPLSYATSLDPDQLEVVIAHELAHLKRFDPFWNLCQLMGEAFLFFNPFLWWISGTIRNEREACCDAFVIRRMGRKREYLHALLRSSEAAVESVLTGAIAFSEKNSNSSLLARVKRILRPDTVPEVQVRPTFIVGLLLGGLAMSWATLLGSEKIARALTAEERISRIELVQKEYTQYAVKRSEVSAEANVERDVLIEGQLLAPNGRSLERRVSMIAFSATGQRTIHSSQRTDAEGRFSFNIKAGRVKLLIDPEDYAAQRINFGAISADQTDLVYTLEAGYAAEVRFIDASTGKPLPDVDAEIRVDGDPQGYPVNLVSDQSGLVTLEHLSGEPIQLKAVKPGYGEGLWKDLRLANNSKQTLELEPVDPVVIRVIDETGRPLQGAKLRVAARNGNGMNMTYGDSGEVVSVSDKDGLLRDESPHGDCLYYYLVNLEGYLGQVVGPLPEGHTSELTLEKQEAVRINFQGFNPSASEAEVRVFQEITTGNSNYGMLPEQIKFDVVQQAANIDYEPKLNLPLHLLLNDQEFVLSPDEWKQGEVSIRLDRRSGGSAGAQSLDPSVVQDGEVSIRIVVPEGGPEASGSLVVGYLEHGAADGVQPRNVYKSISIQAGVGRIKIPLPNEISLQPEGLKGYWFEPKRRIQVGRLSADDRTVQVNTIAAGAIYGRVTDVKGRPVDNVLIGVFEQKSDDTSQTPRNLGVKVKNSAYEDDGRDRYLASPLPLEDTYIISCSRGATYVFSKPIMLTPESPIREIDLVLPDGVDVVGRLLRPDGSPVERHDFGMSVVSDWGRSFSRGSLMTGSGGKFTLKGVNPEIEGETFLVFKGVQGCQPLRYRVDFDVREQMIRLLPGRIVQGQVIDQETGRPVVDAEVYAIRDPYVQGAWPTWFDTEKTDKDGYFEFTNLPKGTFSFGSRSGKLIGYSPVVESSADVSVALTIEAYPWFEGDLADSFPKLLENTSDQD